MLPTSGHNYRRVWTYQPALVGWKNPPELDDWEKAAEENIQINIGNDVWIGRDCFIKASRPDKPLIIGDGAVIASKSMVVKMSRLMRLSAVTPRKLSNIVSTKKLLKNCFASSGGIGTLIKFTTTLNILTASKNLLTCTINKLL